MIDELDGGEREVDALADAADALALRAVDEHRLPPFEAVMARAHRIDPRTVGVDAVAAATGRNATASALLDADGVLDQLVLAARFDARAALDVSARMPAPALRLPRARATTAIAGVAGLVVAAAAAVVLALSLRSNALDRATERDSGSQAAAQAADRADTGGHASVPESDVIPSTPTRPARRSPPREAPDAAALPPAPLETVPPAPAIDPRAVLAPVDATPNPATMRVAHRDRDTPSKRADKLRAMDQDARSQLAAGNFAAADALLASIIGRGGKDRLVEAAFGDRFALAHRLHDRATQRKLWTQYLARFPSGRFADEARAGQCRLAPSDPTACWHEYQHDFPQGAYRAQAARALDRDHDEGSPP